MNSEILYLSRDSMKHRHHAALSFVSQGGKGKKLHYILLQLRNKRLHLLIVKGEPKLDIQDTQDLNDGLWHRVVLNREGNRIMMIVDSNKPKRRKRYPKKLNFGNTMYVGGVPENGILLPDLLVRMALLEKMLLCGSKQLL